MNQDLGFLSEGGNTGKWMREKNWQEFPLGLPSTWPLNLRLMLALVLGSKTPMRLFWGAELYCFFNDACVPLLNPETPAFEQLGATAKISLGEKWPGFSALAGPLLSAKGSGWTEDILMTKNAGRGVEEQFWTFSYSRVNDELNQGAGILSSGLQVAYTLPSEAPKKVEHLIFTNRFAAEQLAAIYHKEFETNEKRFNDLVLQSPIPKAVLRGEDLVVEIANDAILNDLWQRKKETTVGKKILDLFPELKQQRYAALLQNVYKTGRIHAETEAFIYVAEGKERKEYYLDFEYAPLFEGDDNISGIKITAIDVTEKVKARKKLEASEQRFLSLIKQSPVATVILKGPELLIEVVNAAMLERWNKEEKDVVGRKFLEVFPWITNQEIPALLEQVYRTGKKYEKSEAVSYLVDKSGDRTLYVDFEYAPLLEADGTVSAIIAIVKDVTERVETRKKIEKSEQKFRLLADSMPQYIWIADANGSINYYNKSVFEYTGLKPEELMDEGWVKIIHPDDKEKNIKAWSDAVTRGHDFLFEHRFRKHDGEYRWQLSRAIPQRDSNGSIQMWVGTSTDIHDKKNAEEKLDQLVRERTAQLQESNEDLQQFAHVASHDLKEPLRKIKVFTNRVHDEYGSLLPDNARLFLDKIRDASTRMQMMIDGVLAYSTLNATSQAVETIDLNQLIEQVENDLELMIRQTQAKIKKEKLPVIEGAEILIYQLFHNLITNSLKFRHEGVPPFIEIISEIVERNKLLFVKIVLNDKGIGFDRDQAERIFDSFVRLHPKDSFEGNGLGLALCKKIVQRHGGSIEASGAMNKGASFRIYLPLRQNKKIA